MLLACVGLANAALGEDRFAVYRDTLQLTEGGKVECLVIQTATQRLKLIPPKTYDAHIDEFTRTLAFTGDSGKTLITVTFATNSPGVLPATETLKHKVEAKYLGAGFMVSSSCPTGLGAGWMFEIKRIPGADKTLAIMTREAFVAFPDGNIECVLSTIPSEFERTKRYIFAPLLNSLRTENFQPPTPAKAAN